MSMLAALKALLDALLECNHGLFAIPVNRKHPGHAGQWNCTGDRAAFNMAMPATHFISDIGRRIFWRVIKHAKAQTNAVAQGSLWNRGGIRCRPCFCRVGSTLRIL